MRQRRLNGVDEIVLSSYAHGLTTGEISAHFAQIYGASVSKETVSRITDKVVEEMTDWANRPLYAAIGVSLAGDKDVLGLWAGTGGEGAKFWMSVLTDLKNRGVNDVFFLVRDGLKGLPEVVSNVWPLTPVQTSSVHHGGGGIVPSVTRATTVRTRTNVWPSRSRCRPVRPGWWRALHLPAGAAPI